MDKIWDRKSFEVGGHWPLWRGWKNRMTTQNRKKSNAKKNHSRQTIVITTVCICALPCHRYISTSVCIDTLLHTAFRANQTYLVTRTTTIKHTYHHSVRVASLWALLVNTVLDFKNIETLIVKNGNLLLHSDSWTYILFPYSHAYCFQIATPTVSICNDTVNN